MNTVQSVWWVEQQTTQEDLSSVLMGCGVGYAMPKGSGIMTMPEWCVDN